MIRVKHAPSAAAIGESAYTIGRGEKQRWATDVALKQQALGLQAASIRATAGARAGQLALQEEQLDFKKQQWEDEPARQLQKGLQQQKFLQEQERYEYTESQKRRRAQVVEGINWLRGEVSAGKWTAEQAEQAEQQLWGMYHGIIPGPVDVGPGIEQRFESGWVTDKTTGQRWRELPDGKFEKEGMTEAEWGKDYDNSFKVLASATLKAPTPQEVLKHMQAKRTGYAMHQGLAKQTQEEKDRLQQKAVQDLQAIEEQSAITEQAEMDRDVASLPRLFEELVDEPKIGRKIARKGGGIWDKVYGEETYNELFLEVSEAKPDIPPEVIKTELDEWWLAQYERDKGKPWHRYQNPAEFKGAKTGEKVLDEATAMSILQEAGGDKDKARQIAKQRGYIF